MVVKFQPLGVKGGKKTAEPGPWQPPQLIMQVDNVEWYSTDRFWEAKNQSGELSRGEARWAEWFPDESKTEYNVNCIWDEAHHGMFFDTEHDLDCI